MSKQTARRLNKLANILEKMAQGMVNGIELVIRDLANAKRRSRKYGRR